MSELLEQACECHETQGVYLTDLSMRAYESQISSYPTCHRRCQSSKLISNCDEYKVYSMKCGMLYMCYGSISVIFQWCYGQFPGVLLGVTGNCSGVVCIIWSYWCYRWLCWAIGPMVDYT